MRRNDEAQVAVRTAGKGAVCEAGTDISIAGISNPGALVFPGTKPFLGFSSRAIKFVKI